MNGHDNACEDHIHFVKAHCIHFVCKMITHCHLYHYIDCSECVFGRKNYELLDEKIFIMTHQPNN